MGHTTNWTQAKLPSVQTRSDIFEEKTLLNKMTTVEEAVFGSTASGDKVSQYKLCNGKVEVTLISWGATITSVKVSGVDVVLGFDDMGGYTSAEGRDNNGFDHNFVLANTEGNLNFVCRVEHPNSGRWLECYTDQPGVQFYTGNFIPTDDSLTGKQGAVYKKHGGFCLETQKFPDSINQANFPSCVVRPGQQYSHSVLYKFG